MGVEEQLLRDIEDYSSKPHNKYIVDRAKRELSELRKEQILLVKEESKTNIVKEVVDKSKLKKLKKKSK